MKEIIVTGSSGFVGKNLCPYLENLGFKVTYLSLRNDDWKERFPKNAFAVLHLAGLAHDLKNTNKEADYFRVNTELTQEIYDLFLDSEIKKFIYFSSVKAVADSLGDEILDENHKPNPITTYGKSKLKAEQYILSKNLKTEQKAYILRPSMIHGPDNKGNLNLLYGMISKGIPYPFAAFENERSFLSIDNLNFVVSELLVNNINSGVYNVTDSTYISTYNLINLINRVIGKKAKIFKVNKKVIIFVAKIGDLIKFPFTTEKLNKLTENFRVSNRKLVRELGKELPINAEEGLILTIKSFNKKNN